MPKVNGLVMDASTGETLPGAHVYVADTANGAVTDVDGRFALDIQRGERVTVSFVGYTPLTFVPSGDAYVVELVPGVGLDEFEVTADRPGSLLLGGLIFTIAIAYLVSEDDTPRR